MNNIREAVYREYNKIGVFLDVGDGQFPDYFDPGKMYKSIEEVLGFFGYLGELSVFAYRENNSIPEQWVRASRDGEIIFKPDVPGDKYARVGRMLVDMLLFADETPGANLAFLSDAIYKDPVIVSVVQARKFWVFVGEYDMSHMMYSSLTMQPFRDFQCPPCPKRIDDTSVDRGSPDDPGNGIFWDLDDYPVPRDIGSESIYCNLGNALAEKKRTGDVSIWGYGESETQAFPVHSNPDSRFRIGFVPDEVLACYWTCFSGRLTIPLTMMNVHL